MSVKDGGSWEDHLLSNLGPDLRQRLGQHVNVAEGDLVILSAGLTTQAVNALNLFDFYHNLIWRLMLPLRHPVMLILVLTDSLRTNFKSLSL